MMNSERKPDGLQHCEIALVLITPLIKMRSCSQMLVPAGVHRICITKIVICITPSPKTNAHWGRLELVQQFQFQAAVQRCKCWSDSGV